MGDVEVTTGRRRDIRLSAAIGNRTRLQANWNKQGSETLRRLQDSDKQSGFEKIYAPIDEEGTQLDPQNQMVRDTAAEILQDFREQAIPRWDAEAVLCFGNQEAKGDIAVDGNVILRNVPVTMLLFLEDQLEHVIAYLRKAVVLRDDQEWALNEVSGLFRSNTLTTQRNEKSVDFPVISPAQVIDGHPFPAQYEKRAIVTLVGNWNTTLLSGSMSAIRRRELVERGETLLKAVRRAREEANATMVKPQSVAAPILDWWLAE